MRIRWTTDTAIEKLKQVHGDKYTYENFIYVNSSTKITLTCKIHGDFQTLYHNSIKGHGCKKCSSTLLHNKQRKTTETFMQESKELWGKDTFDYSLVEYKTARLPVVLVCKAHQQEFKQSPTNHLRKNGLWVSCPICLGKKQAFGVPTILYYLYHKPSKLFKIGITTTTVEARFRAEYNDFDTLATWSFCRGEDASELEATILELFKNFRVFNGLLKSNGGTEFFSKDILGLKPS